MRRTWRPEGTQLPDAAGGLAFPCPEATGSKRQGPADWALIPYDVAWRRSGLAGIAEGKPQGLRGNPVNPI